VRPGDLDDAKRIAGTGVVTAMETCNELSSIRAAARPRAPVAGRAARFFGSFTQLRVSHRCGNKLAEEQRGRETPVTHSRGRIRACRLQQEMAYGAATRNVAVQHLGINCFLSDRPSL